MNNPQSIDDPRQVGVGFANMRRSAAIVTVAALLALAGCAAGDTVTTEPGDSYERYLELAPDDAPYLTRTEAQDWRDNACAERADGWDHSTAHSPPGSVQHALIRAYGC